MSIGEFTSRLEKLVNRVHLFIAKNEEEVHLPAGFENVHRLTELDRQAVFLDSQVTKYKTKISSWFTPLPPPPHPP